MEVSEEKLNVCFAITKQFLVRYYRWVVVLTLYKNMTRWISLFMKRKKKLIFIYKNKCCQPTISSEAYEYDCCCGLNTRHYVKKKRWIWLVYEICLTSVIFFDINNTVHWFRSTEPFSILKQELNIHNLCFMVQLWRGNKAKTNVWCAFRWIDFLPGRIYFSLLWFNIRACRTISNNI